MKMQLESTEKFRHGSVIDLDAITYLSGWSPGTIRTQNVTLIIDSVTMKLDMLKTDYDKIFDYMKKDFLTFNEVK